MSLDFRYSSFMPQELIDFFQRKQKTWKEIEDDTSSSHFEFQIHMVEKVNYEDYVSPLAEQERESKREIDEAVDNDRTHPLRWMTRITTPPSPMKNNSLTLKNADPSSLLSIFQGWDEEVSEANENNHSSNSRWRPRKNPIKEGIGVYGLVDKETRVYMRYEDFNPYVSVDIPSDWDKDTIDFFCNHVLCTSIPFQRHAKHLVGLENIRKDWLSKQHWDMTKPEKERRTGVEYWRDEMEKRRLDTHGDDTSLTLQCLTSRDDILRVETPDYSSATQHRVEGRALRIFVRQSYHATKIYQFMNRSSVRKTLVNLFDLKEEESLCDEEHKLFKVYDIYGLKERFFVDNDVCTNMWVQFDKNRCEEVYTEHRKMWNSGMLELRTSTAATLRLPNKVLLVPARRLGYDIEQWSHDFDRFPSAEDKRDLIYMEAFNYSTDDEQQIQWKISIVISLVLKQSVDYENRDITLVVTSFAAFCDLKQTLYHIVDPDILVAYNNHNYDNPQSQKYAGTMGLCKAGNTWMGKRTFEPIFPRGDVATFEEDFQQVEATEFLAALQREEDARLERLRLKEKMDLLDAAPSPESRTDEVDDSITASNKRKKLETIEKEQVKKEEEEDQVMVKAEPEWSPQRPPSRWSQPKEYDLNGELIRPSSYSKNTNHPYSSSSSSPSSFPAWSQFTSHYNRSSFYSKNASRFRKMYDAEGNEQVKMEDGEEENGNSEIMPVFGYFSRRANHFCPCDEVESQSKQTGASKAYRWMIGGRWNIDIYKDVKANEKLSSYKLNDVAFAKVGKKKIDIAPREQFKKYAQGYIPNSPTAAQDHEDLNKYCKQDSVLPILLLDYYFIRIKFAESSRANKLDGDDQSHRGQQVRVMNNILLECQNKKFYKKVFLVPNRENVREDTVLLHSAGYSSSTSSTSGDQGEESIQWNESEEDGNHGGDVADVVDLPVEEGDELMHEEYERVIEREEESHPEVDEEDQMPSLESITENLRECGLDNIADELEKKNHPEEISSVPVKLPYNDPLAVSHPEEYIQNHQHRLEYRYRQDELIWNPHWD